MLGGVDHAAALVAKGKQEAPHSVVVGAGPLFFLNPELTPEKRQQDVWKAHSIAASLQDLGLVAWAPGTNDLAAGTGELALLTKASGAHLLAANLTIEGVPTAAPQVLEVGDRKLGIAGVGQWGAARPNAVSENDAAEALTAAKRQLEEQGAQLLIALVAAPRGEALRLAESVTGFSVMVVGKPLDRGESNDAPTPPVMVGTTLVVQGPNHLQSLAIVDLFVEGDDVAFADGSGIEAQEKRQSLERRVAELSTRLAGWRGEGKVDPKDLAAREADLTKLQRELTQLSKPRPAPEGSFFRYDLEDVREGLGSDERVLERMRGYYKQVNDHNREALGDRRPAAVAAGQASYSGGNACVECHEDAVEFWQGTGHAHAYETLVKDFKEFNLDCVGCHVTGYEQPGGSTVTFVDNLKDVQCESCHGPGSIHVKNEDTDAINLTPEESVCKQCHHAPHVADDWDVKEAWKHIIGKGHGEPAGEPASPEDPKVPKVPPAAGRGTGGQRG